MKFFTQYLQFRWNIARIEEAALRKRLNKIRVVRPYQTSITTNMMFYVLSGWSFVSGVVLVLFLAVVLVALVNAGLWWIAGGLLAGFPI
jgi:hypothetical protein